MQADAGAVGGRAGRERVERIETGQRCSCVQRCPVCFGVEGHAAGLSVGSDVAKPRRRTGSALPIRQPDRRDACRGSRQAPLDQSLDVSSGTTLNRSPTKPISATWKIGASSSLLIAMIVFESFIPARCWIAPEMPTAI